MLKLLSTILTIFISTATYASGAFDFSYGFFSINSKSEGKKATISNPSAFNVAYLRPVSEKFQLNLGYSVLLSDFQGSDKGYGVNLGLNYFILSSALNEQLKNEFFEAERFQVWKPFIGVGFYQRNFQSIKNSYAGFGINSGVERYLNKKTSLKGEFRFISLSGSGDSTAIESNAFIGIILRI